jgi:hypothetical protein
MQYRYIFLKVPTMPLEVFCLSRDITDRWVRFRSPTDESSIVRWVANLTWVIELTPRGELRTLGTSVSRSQHSFQGAQHPDGDELLLSLIKTTQSRELITLDEDRQYRPPNSSSVSAGSPALWELLYQSQLTLCRKPSTLATTILCPIQINHWREVSASLTPSTPGTP